MTSHPLIDSAGNLMGTLRAAADLAAAGDRLERLRVESDRKADALRARWAKNSAEHFRRRDLENGR